MERLFSKVLRTRAWAQRGWVTCPRSHSKHAHVDWTSLSRLLARGRCLESLEMGSGGTKAAPVSPGPPPLLTVSLLLAGPPRHPPWQGCGQPVLAVDLPTTAQHQPSLEAGADSNAGVDESRGEGGACGSRTHRRLWQVPPACARGPGGGSHAAFTAPGLPGAGLYTQWVSTRCFLTEWTDGGWTRRGRAWC